MSDEITLRLSRADADAIRRAMDGGLIAWDDASEAWMHVETPTMIAALAAALAADPADARAILGERQPNTAENRQNLLERDALAADPAPEAARIEWAKAAEVVRCADMFVDDHFGCIDLTDARKIVIDAVIEWRDARDAVWEAGGDSLTDPAPEPEPTLLDWDQINEAIAARLAEDDAQVAAMQRAAGEETGA